MARKEEVKAQHFWSIRILLYFYLVVILSYSQTLAAIAYPPARARLA